MNGQYASALHAGDRERLGVDQRREHAAVEAHADTRSRKHFHAAASIEGEADRMIGLDAVPGEAQHAGEEGTHAAAALNPLQPSCLPVIDRLAVARRRREPLGPGGRRR